MIPFKSGVIVTDRDFCGRAKEVETLQEKVASGARILVSGSRRIGKSSLIVESVRRMRKHRLLLVDLYGIRTESDVSRHIVDGILSLESDLTAVTKLLQAFGSLRPTVGVDPGSGLPTVSLAPTTRLLPESLEQALDYIGTLKNVVVCFDEFQELLKLSDPHQVIARMRSRIQRQNSIAYLFSGSVRNEMDTLFHDPDSPFFKSAVRMDVGPIELSTFEEYIRAKFKTGKRKATRDAARQIIEAAYGTPGDVQRLCECIWDVTEPGEEIAKVQVAMGLERVFVGERRTFEAYLSNVSAQQLECLRALSECDGISNMSREFVALTGIAHSSSVQRALNGLVKKRILEKRGTSYAVCDPFFGRWLLKERI